MTFVRDHTQCYLPAKKYNLDSKLTLTCWNASSNKRSMELPPYPTPPKKRKKKRRSEDDQPVNGDFEEQNLVKEELESQMRAEFLNRIDGIVIFSPLGKFDLFSISKFDRGGNH